MEWVTVVQLSAERVCVLPQGAMALQISANSELEHYSRRMLEPASPENKASSKNFTDNTRDFNQTLTEATFFTLHDPLTATEHSDVWPNSASTRFCVLRWLQ